MPSMTKPRRTCAAFAAALLLAVPVAQACMPSPEQAAAAWARTYLACDFPAAWPLLSREEREAARSRLAWVQSVTEGAAASFACRNTVHGVTIASRSPTAASAEVEIGVPVVAMEIARIEERARYADILESRQMERAAELARARAIAAGEWEPRMRQVVHVELVAENGAWCVDAGIADNARVQALENARFREEAARRQREAEARAQLQARGEAARERVTVDRLRRGDVAGTARPVPGVFGELVNNSDETLSRVVVVVEFLDRDGRPIFDREYPLVSVSAYTSDRPLGPGHRRPFGYRVEDAPAAWAGGVRARVTRTEVHDPSARP
jgi:hypothetical protein